MKYIKEACVGSIKEALIAERNGADRIELCDNLAMGGTTQSLGTIEVANEVLSIPVNVIIRPRGGDFVYDDIEVEIMKWDIEQCRRIGVNGIVIGMLDEKNNINMEQLLYLLKYVGDMEVTFHMAFDEVENPFNAIDLLASLKINRILTKGGKEGTAIDNCESLKKYIEYSKDRIIILPGSGITKDNAEALRAYTGALELHGTKIV